MIICIKYKKWAFNSIKIIFTLLFVFVLFKVIDIGELVTLAQKIDAKTFTYGFVTYTLVCILRTIRFSILVKSPVKYLNLFFIVAVHGFFNRVMPLRLGESVFPYYMKRVENVRYTESIMALFVVRIFDLMSTLAVLIFVMIFILHNTIYSFFLSALLIAGAVVFFNLHIIFRYIILHVNKIKRLKSAAESFNYLAEEYSSLLGYKKMIVLAAISIVIWFLLFYFFAIFMNALNMHLPFMDIVLAGTFSNISSILPISAFGNFGTMELGWTGALVNRGVGSGQAFLSGFLSNMLTFIDTAILGIMGFIFFKIKQRPH